MEHKNNAEEGRNVNRKLAILLTTALVAVFGAAACGGTAEDVQE